MSTDTEICIGGPLAGQRYAAPKGNNEFTVAAEIFNPVVTAATPEGSARIERHTYIKKNLAPPARPSLIVWVHQSLLTPYCIMRELVLGYKEERK